SEYDSAVRMSWLPCGPGKAFRQPPSMAQHSVGKGRPVTSSQPAVVLPSKRDCQARSCGESCARAALAPHARRKRRRRAADFAFGGFVRLGSEGGMIPGPSVDEV